MRSDYILLMMEFGICAFRYGKMTSDQKTDHFATHYILFHFCLQMIDIRTKDIGCVQQNMLLCNHLMILICDQRILFVRFLTDLKI